MKREAASASMLWPIVVKRVGWRRGYKALLHAACWWIGEREKGGPFATVDEYADHWSLSRATAFRDQQAFRGAFPSCETPRELADLIGFKVQPGENETMACARLIGWRVVPGL